MKILLFLILGLCVGGGMYFIISARIPRVEKDHKRFMKQLGRTVRKIEKDQKDQEES